MASFHNVRLSDRVLVGATGGPGFKTSIVETASGDEFRNIQWSRQRGHWNIGYTDDHAKIKEIVSFFHARRGRAYGFRFKDWSDYQVDCDFAAGDGETTEFQALKVYGEASYAFRRPLTRLVAPVTVTVDGVPAGPAIDVDTGKIVFGVAPADGAVLHIKCEFDVPVRFDIDDLSTTMITKGLSSLDSVPVIEIRDRKDPT